MGELELRCTCGAVVGALVGATPTNGTRLTCMCDDCQAYAQFLGRPADVLDANGGTEVYQSVPSRIRLTEGIDQIRCVRQSAKGLMRWYTACCRTPVANMLASPRVPFASVVEPFYRHHDAAELQRRLGPVRARTQARFGFGELPADAHSRAPLGVIVHALRVLGGGFLGGAHSPHPFFHDGGEPIAVPQVLSVDERARLREAAGRWREAFLSGERDN